MANSRATAAARQQTAEKPKRKAKVIPPQLAEKMKNAAIVSKAAVKVYTAVEGLTDEQKKEAWTLATDQPASSNN